MASNSTYGAAFADVYDEWYGTSDDLAAVVALLARESPRRVLELGVGTGRLAIPLARALNDHGHSVEVLGIDESSEMLSLLHNHPGAELIDAVLGDMVDDQPDGPFDLIYCSYNTLFNVIGSSRQAQCIANATARLSPGGLLIIDACIIADDAPARGSSVTQRGQWTLTSESSFDSSTGALTTTITSRHDDGRVVVRPTTITYSRPDSIDTMCRAAGLELHARYSSWHMTTFDQSAARHVSVYRNLR